MRALTSGTNIDEATTDYPNGRVRDKSGTTEGTLLNEVLIGDIIQALQKLINLAGVTPNGNPDNETNYHQIITALFSQSMPEWQSSDNNVDFSLTKFVRYSGGIYYHKTTSNATTSPDSDTTNWVYIIGYNTSTGLVSMPTDYINSERGKLVYSAHILWNDSTITKTEYINGSFISSISEVASNKLGIYLSSSITDWETKLEIQATSNPLNSDSVNRNPHFFYESSSYISMHLIDSSGNPTDDGAVWIRIYDWR